MWFELWQVLRKIAYMYIYFISHVYISRIWISILMVIQARRPKKSVYFVPVFFQYNAYFHFAPKSGWGIYMRGYMHIYAPRWSLASQFWSYPLPKIVSLFVPKMTHFKGMRTHFWNKSQTHTKNLLIFLAVLVAELMSRPSRLSRTTSDPAKKHGNIQAKISFFLFFRRDICHNFVTPFSTFANIKGSLPTNSTTPNRNRLR